MLWFFTLKIQKYLIYAIIISSVLVQAQKRKKQRYVGLSGCSAISAFEYECCAGINLANVPGNECKYYISIISKFNNSPPKKVE